jgi:DNA-binding transcriptional ArsR family regulator
LSSATELSEATAFGISARMARAVADPWRVRILAELSVRSLSPSRFVEEIGGELTDVARYFRQLAALGYIELIEERPGRRRGAAIEHVYRGIHRAHFDTSTWEGVPRSDRYAISRAAVSSFFARVSEAIGAGTFEMELDRHLSWDGVVLDREAWGQLSERLDEVLAWLSDLEPEAAKRLTADQRERVPTIVGLSAFRSTQSPSLMLKASRCHQPPSVAADNDAFAIGPKLSKALSNRWRCRILMELTSRPLSPSQFVQEIGGSKSHIARCFRELSDWGYVEVFEEKRGGRRRGGVELIYRNARRPFFDTPTWITLPRLVREEMSQAFLSTYHQRISEALDEGTFDAETDRHFSWKPLALDRLAWTEVGEALDEVLAWLPNLEADSIERSEGHIDQLIPTMVSLFSFRSPQHLKFEG